MFTTLLVDCSRVYTIQYIGDYQSPWTGNSVLNQPVLKGRSCECWRPLNDMSKKYIFRIIPNILLSTSKSQCITYNFTILKVGVLPCPKPSSPPCIRGFYTIPPCWLECRWRRPPRHLPMSQSLLVPSTRISSPGRNPSPLRQMVPTLSQRTWPGALGAAWWAWKLVGLSLGINCQESA